MNNIETNTFLAMAANFLAALNNGHELTDNEKVILILIRNRLDTMLSGEGTIEISPSGGGAKRTATATANSSEEKEAESSEKGGKSKRMRPSPTPAQLLEGMEDAVDTVKDLWFNQRYANHKQMAEVVARYAAEEHADLFKVEESKDDKHLVEIINRGDSLVNSKMLMWAMECIWARLPASEKLRIQEEEMDKIKTHVNACAKERHEKEVEYHNTSFALLGKEGATFTMWVSDPETEDDEKTKGGKRKRGSPVEKVHCLFKVVSAADAPFSTTPDEGTPITKLGQFLKDADKSTTIRIVKMEDKGEWTEVDDDNEDATNMTIKFVATKNRWVLEKTGDTLRFEDVFEAKAEPEDAALPVEVSAAPATKKARVEAPAAAPAPAPAPAPALAEPEADAAHVEVSAAPTATKKARVEDEQEAPSGEKRHKKKRRHHITSADDGKKLTDDGKKLTVTNKGDTVTESGLLVRKMTIGL